MQSDYVQLEWGKLSLTFRIKLTGIQTTTSLALTLYSLCLKKYIIPQSPYPNFTRYSLGGNHYNGNNDEPNFVTVIPVHAIAVNVKH